MYAIIEDSGSQMKVEEGDRFEIDIRDAKVDDELTFDRVLMVGSGEGNSKIGTPYVDGAAVKAKVIAESQHLVTRQLAKIDGSDRLIFEFVPGIQLVCPQHESQRSSIVGQLAQLEELGHVRP